MTPQRSIDVVIPVHNGATLVTRAIQSVTAQSGNWDIHLYCIDDGSTDDSLAVLRSLAEKIPRVTVLSNPICRGVAASRNRAVALGTSPLVAFLDQDDEWVPHKLALQVPRFTADPSLFYAIGAQQFVLDGQPLPAWCRAEWLEAPQPGFLPSALMVRREAWNTVGPLDTTLVAGADDLDWFARARSRKAPFVSLAEVVLLRHVHAENASANVTGSNLAVLSAVRQNLKSKRASHDS